jgi:hypothetical protein
MRKIVGHAIANVELSEQSSIAFFATGLCIFSCIFWLFDMNGRDTASLYLAAVLVSGASNIRKQRAATR